MLIPAGYPYLAISKSLIFSMAFFFGLFFFFIVSLVIHTLRKRAITGKEELIGSIGEARSDLNPKGLVFVLGALWQASAPSGIVIKKGEGIKVTGSEGLKLKVEHYNQDNQEQ